MFGTRRLAKRSIIGTQVCARWVEDGRYYPGVIQSTAEWPNGEDVYSVRLSDLKITKTYQDKDLIGPGFQTINVAVLKHGQKVFITHNTRETTGTVISHDRECDDVLITVDLLDGGHTEVIKKLEEIRLMESRKSSRLQNHHDTDYSRMADFQMEPKRRTVSHSIDVPLIKTPRRRRTYSANSPSHDDDDEYMDCITDLNHFRERAKEGRESSPEVMDDTMAAMVLTSLSSSPLSPTYPQLPDKFKFKGGMSPAPSSSNGSSGVWGVKSNSSTPSPPRFSNTSSPSHFLSSSAPVSGDPVFSGLQVDEGIEVDDTAAFFAEESGSRKRRASTRTVFKCTWPQCGKLHNSCSGIEKHVRQAHLGPKPARDSDESDESDHEEEFYYTEIEVSVDTVTQTFADMHTSSPPPISGVYDLTSGASVSADHDYQKKSMPMSIPTSRDHADYTHGNSLPGSLGMHTNKLPRSYTWQSSAAKMIKSSNHGPSRGYSISASPKNSPLHKKPRSDTKKCRKVYGMENRDLWCTQCKWKKACTRFLD